MPNTARPAPSPRAASPLNIALIGFRGAGKTAVSTALAETLGSARYSTDEETTARAGAESVADIVRERGWAEFRRLESECVRALAAAQDGRVIDCGGGVVENPDNLRALAATSLVVWIYAELDDVLQRLFAEPLHNQRPLLGASGGARASDNTDKAHIATPKDATPSAEVMRRDITENYARRLPLYAAAAVFTVNTSLLGVDEAAARIAEFLRAAYASSSAAQNK
jgi:shikimate kinase